VRAVLAYLFWHRAAAAVEQSAYERELERFHRSLAHGPPSGFRCTASFRVEQLPWLAADAAADLTPEEHRAAYEDWYLIDDWAALGVLEEAAISRGHMTAHDAIAARAGWGSGAVYRLLEGSSNPAHGDAAVWVSAVPGHNRMSLDALLGDGLDPRRGGLWRRCLGLGPAPEYCLLADQQPAGVAASRLPVGWSVRSVGRKPVWND
jgi:hypothetical protein